MAEKKTLVIGASENKQRYSNMAVKKLLANRHPVIALGKKEGMIENTPIITKTGPIEGLDTITLYLNPANQKQYYDYILSLRPKRLIFNPGTENEELEILAKKEHIETVEACTLVLLSTAQY